MFWFLTYLVGLLCLKYQAKGLKEKGFKMKFYIRRAVVGVLAVPVVAGVYTFIWLALIIAGAEASLSAEQVFQSGLGLGAIVAVMFTFSPQVSRLLDRIVGE